MISHRSTCPVRITPNPSKRPRKSINIKQKSKINKPNKSQPTKISKSPHFPQRNNPNTLNSPKPNPKQLLTQISHPLKPTKDNRASKRKRRTKTKLTPSSPLKTAKLHIKMAWLQRNPQDQAHKSQKAQLRKWQSKNLKADQCCQVKSWASSSKCSRRLHQHLNSNPQHEVYDCNTLIDLCSLNLVIGSD